MTASDAVKLANRRAKATKLETLAQRAAIAFTQISGLRDRVLIRPEFMCRTTPAPLEGEPSDRRLPNRAERPPATRLVSPRGIALRLYLTALLEAQTRSPGEKPTNHRPLADPDRPSWLELFAVPAERYAGKVVTSPRDKRIRQLQDAIQRLASPEIQLVDLPNLAKATKKYEGFTLLLEQGRPYDGGDNDPYTVPQVTRLPYLPTSFFLNGWVHVLEDSEIVFLLMLAWLRYRWPAAEYHFLKGEWRILHFGLGRDTYQAHQMLERLGLVNVQEDENRDIFQPGLIHGYDKNKAPKLHRFKLLNEGFDQPALPTLLSTIDRRLATRAGMTTPASA
ncbi:hypothetical protein FJK98_32160 [Micromonospora sp. HM134]|uniref:hypothetical protein n=1 Tax=Micromonospora sp. HM134 TaxID=2583243 RepID=UPI0011983FA0|nr:hypothetical protein [Micromonospora sp. HM134]QDY11218.1 hypothetical protein FJK98_32160 [Micromonospora sp. HM134]